MNDYRCDHGGMAMGRDCEKCKALEAVDKLKIGSVHRGRNPKTNRFAYRIVIDVTFGKDVLYYRGKSTKSWQCRRRCAGLEWLDFIAARKGK